MGDLQENSDQSADALKALAEGRQQAPADAFEAAAKGPAMEAEDALARLAAGEFEPAAGQDDPPDDPPAGGDGELAAVAADVLGDADCQPRKVRRENQDRTQAHSHGAGFRKLMVPLLVLVGCVLLVLSGMTVVMLLVGRAADVQPSMLRRNGPWLVLVSCPVAAVLLAGAWWLHHEAGRPRQR